MPSLKREIHFAQHCICNEIMIYDQLVTLSSGGINFFHFTESISFWYFSGTIFCLYHAVLDTWIVLSFDGGLERLPLMFQCAIQQHSSLLYTCSRSHNIPSSKFVFNIIFAEYEIC